MTAMTDAAAATPSRRRRPPAIGLGGWYAEHQRLVLGIAGILMVLIPWELAVRLGFVKEILISSPSAVAESFVTEFVRGDIWRHIWASGRVWLVGYAFASVLGILIGLAAGWYRRVGLITVPWLNFVYAAPDLAFVPRLEAGLEHRLPYIMTGLRVASGRAIVGVVGAEFISSNEGLGFLISISGTTLQTSRVFVGIILLAAFGVILNEVLGRVEHRFDAWRREVHA